MSLHLIVTMFMSFSALSGPCRCQMSPAFLFHLSSFHENVIVVSCDLVLPCWQLDVPFSSRSQHCGLLEPVDVACDVR
ncbi:hypothetical protein P152DRAFT_60167 [Eremomyces bilateralis CBS 781.70]|uniref:Secreted protein n=1 Tax=Eremomyces bilateralis CBS 781.70 TaxID=1392243 RepID=A0A6G1G185_9PEZI|nr:uncharacterized protein P152DRAFT_60167 [Eremomyces bilateralis CBS 781.70]KAF1811569.1 hypothetical protein P152DRAFT_60167 [Eremomyces bilateralis CBS 781.70]